MHIYLCFMRSGKCVVVDGVNESNQLGLTCTLTRLCHGHTLQL